jgi:hypothetical protein
MGDIDSLLKAFEAGTLVRPRHEEPNIVDLVRSIARLMGASSVQETPNSLDIELRIGAADHLVFVLLDGVGMNVLDGMPRDAFLPQHLDRELFTVFPSTTAVALTSLATGQWPASHAVTGWWTHLDQVGAPVVVLRYVTRAENRDLAELGVEPEMAFPVPSILSQFKRDAQVVVPAYLVDSTYSRYFSGGRPIVGYSSIRDAVTMVARRVSEATEPTFTYLYFPHVDSLAHLHGMTRPEVRGALMEVDVALARLHTEVGGKCRIVMTADHGLKDTPVSARHTLRPSQELLPLLRFPPSGDARVMYLHLWDWARERVRRHFQSKFGDRFHLITVDEADALRLFGPEPLSAETRNRMGDLVSISAGADMLEYHGERGPGHSVKLNCHHSGLTPEEMRVPLAIA